MASYLELRGLFGDDDLRNKVTTAIVINIEAKLNQASSPESTVNAKKFALDVIENPDTWGQKILALVLAANGNLAVATIQGAADNAIQTNVDDVIDGIIVAEYGSL